MHEALERTPILEARGVSKAYGQGDGRACEVIARTDLAIYPDQIVALLGPSGCGKSTILRMLTGLVAPTSGEILWHGRPLNGVRPSVSIVFQSFALFPWLTVLENVETPLEAQGMGAAQRLERAQRILDTVGLDGFENAYPKELSGGMKQRVGFARALGVEPEVLFMDEPFSALDVLMAETLRGELLELWGQRKIPTRAIFIVTHNIEEAVILADRIVVLGHHPSQIRADFAVTLSQPRDRKSGPFTELVDYIYKILTQPELVPSAVPSESKPAAAGAVQSKFVLLPHARPTSIAGLLEILAEHGGQDDLYQMASKLGLELDDLLPIVNAAATLGFLRLHEGDAELTTTGGTFAAADILSRRSLFREAALAHVPLMREIRQALRSKADHALADDFFLDIIGEHTSEPEAARQLETATWWGRYAEILEYDAARGRLVLTEEEIARTA